MFRRIADEPVEFGRITLVSAEYREFVCSVETAEWMLAGGFTSLDGRPVRLQIMDTLRGGFNVVVKVWDAPELVDAAREIQAEAWVAA